MRPLFRKKDYIDQEISVFKPNAIDFFWMMLFIILNTVLTIRSTSLMKYTIRIFIYDLFNIILTLVMFLAAEQVKKYHKEWSYVVIGVGVFQLLHIAFLPEHTNTIFIIVLYVITGVLAIYAGVSSLIKSIFRSKYVKKEGV